MNEVSLKKVPPYVWTIGVIIFAALCVSYYSAITHMVEVWESKEEYGHGFLIPLLSVFFVWQKKNELAKADFSGSWIGYLIVLFGLLLAIAGQLATIFVIVQYALVIIVIGLVYSYLGYNSFKKIAVPLFMLFLMIPLPVFLYQGLSSALQLLSTKIGVGVIRLFDISVFVEGNVIDLGQYKLQVVEACSGLRYLFPLLTLGLIAAYIFKQPVWKRVVLFLSTVPITVFMNSFRIGVIGVTVEYWGSDMAEGFLHDFEGWVVFMSCIAILMLEMWVLLRIGSSKMSFSEAFSLDFPEKAETDDGVVERRTPTSLMASMVTVILVAGAVLAMPEHEEIVPDRKNYQEFPMVVGEWQGKSDILETYFIDTLKLSDYALINYIGSENKAINFYSAFYNSQKSGASAHSPRSCIPGGGWKIASHEVVTVDGVEISSVPLKVNRLVIQKNEVKQLVYYWFQQRGRIVTDEYAMKWYLLWDSMTRERTDGALMRITTLVDQYDSLDKADARLKAFVTEIAPIVPEYVPD